MKEHRQMADNVMDDVGSRGVIKMPSLPHVHCDREAFAGEKVSVNGRRHVPFYKSDAPSGWQQSPIQHVRRGNSIAGQFELPEPIKIWLVNILGMSRQEPAVIL